MNARRGLLTWAGIAGTVAALSLSTLPAGAAQAARPAHLATAQAKVKPKKPGKKTTTTTAPTSTPPPSTAALNFTIRLTEAKVPPLTATGIGHVAFTTHQLAATFNIPAGITPLTDLLPASLVKMVPAELGNATQAQVLISGGTVYVSVPGLSAFLTKQKTWLGIHQKASLGGAFSASARGFGKATLIVSDLKGRNGHVSKLKPSTIETVQAHGWLVQASPSALVRAIPGLGPLLAPIASTLGSTVPVKIWANRTGQLLEVTTSVSRPKAHSGIQSLRIAMTVSNLSAGLSISPPPNSQVESVPASVLKELTGPSSKKG